MILSFMDPGNAVSTTYQSHCTVLVQKQKVLELMAINCRYFLAAGEKVTAT